jgi:hypothetical protein
MGRHLLAAHALSVNYNAIKAARWPRWTRRPSQSASMGSRHLKGKPVPASAQIEQ